MQFYFVLHYLVILDIYLIDKSEKKRHKMKKIIFTALLSFFMISVFSQTMISTQPHNGTATHGTFAPDGSFYSVGDDGFVGMVNDHAGLAAGGLFHLLHRRHIHRNVLSALGFGIVGCQLSRLGHGVVRGRGAAAGDDHMAAVDLLGMEPNIILPGQAEGQFVVLMVVSAHIDGVAVGGFKSHRLAPDLLHPLFAGVSSDIAADLKLLADLLQLPFRFRPAQLLQHAFQVLKLLLRQGHLAGQLLLGGFQLGIVLIEFSRILLGRQQG